MDFSKSIKEVRKFNTMSPKNYLLKRIILAFATALVALWIVSRPQLPKAQAQSQSPDFKNFEGPQIHPLAITPDGTRLLALNTPENRLSIFQLTGSALSLTAEVPVGLEPVSVAARNDREAWVTNWLSDSVSVVDLTSGNVIRTIDVGDEPTDVVFAGQEREMAFVCVSGLNQVKAFDPHAPTASPQVINIRGKQPRSLARDSSGAQVFVSVFESGNGTTIVPAAQVTAAGGLPAPSPALSGTLPRAPDAGLIVKWNGSRWADERGDTKWSQFIPYTLADIDVVVLDARGATPAISIQVRGVGTHIGNAVFDSSANRLYVANMEARNTIRFEPNLSGRFISNRVSLIRLGTDTPSVSTLDLNPHINYDAPASSDQERANSLALPADIARSTDGTLYVAATGSAKVGVLDAKGVVRKRISVGQGPTGLALDEGQGRLYVLNRFDETLSVVDTRTKTEITRVPIGYNPEPSNVRAGRRFLYDASLSAHGDVSCASCHLNGHRDGLAWDLGNPQGAMQQVNGLGGILPIPSIFHPMKGPMTTQSMRGIIGTGPLHWRGDRASLADFNPAFVSLLGSQRQLTASEMASFEAFVRTLTYPPNPNQNLDRTYPNPATGPSAARGLQLFTTSRLDQNVFTCNQCHSASPGFGPGTNKLIIPAVALQEPQDFKVPQLRGMYQKLGMRNAPGEQLSGFGFIHDGSFDTLISFLHAPVFNFRNDDDRRDVEQFVLAFDTGTAPAVGLQVTINGSNKTSSTTANRVNLLIAQADTGNCDLVAKRVSGGVQRGFVYVGNGMFQSDKRSEAQVSWQTLMNTADAGAELTFTGVPVGSGRRIGIDRDLDGTFDGDALTGPISINGQIVNAAGNGIGGVSIALSGAQSATTLTDSSGRFSFGNLSAGGSYTIVPSKEGYAFNPLNQTFTNLSGDLTVNFIAPTIVQFSVATYQAAENAGRATITVQRTGDTSGAVTVDYATIDNPALVRCDKAGGIAYARCDYSSTVDALHFAPGETQKTFTIPIIDDAYTEGNETLSLTLSNPINASLGSQSAATLTINDNDAAQSANPILDPQFFVRMQYLDFLSREPEPDGFNAWVGVLNRCTGNTLDCDRTEVSASFFRSAEFQLKGYFVYRFYKVSLGRLPHYTEIIQDMRSVTGQTGDEVTAKKAAFINEWVQQPEFTAIYGSLLDPAAYVDRLLQTAGVQLTGAITRDSLVQDLRGGLKTRAEVLRAIVESAEVDRQEYNGAFVAMQYFGYLRRDPDQDGYDAWLRVIKRNPADYRTMVEGFSNSTEYKLRFGQ